MFSPMSSFIFYPAITSMAQSLHTTVGKIDLAITTYMVVSGVTPAVLGGAADNMGRRPVYIVALAIYLTANVGLALQSNYTSLLILRMVQSAGSSGYGVISDIADPSERGLYVGTFNMGPNVAPPFGPVLGGLVTSQLNWQWVFWVLAILGGFCLLLVVVSLPETARNIVGDGSAPAPGGIYRPLVHLMALKDGKAVVRPRRPRFVVPNPVSCLRLLFFKDIFIVLLCNGVYYATYCCVQATLASLFVEVYGYHELQAGLVYIPFGLGCLVATYSWGRLLNYDYARVKRPYESRMTEATMTDYHSEDFPIEQARLCSCFYLVGVVAVSTTAYGWVVGLRVHVAVPLFLQTVIGYGITGIFGVRSRNLTHRFESIAVVHRSGLRQRCEMQPSRGQPRRNPARDRRNRRWLVLYHRGLIVGMLWSAPATGDEARTEVEDAKKAKYADPRINDGVIPIENKVMS
ncbi:multidrug resistance protein [Apiospora saccharicola]|uniref:Multidrug resistance protein n=1 Tax=Apiospora saccharicola TaxID=335842 RepID=A0ABR1U3V7_9PEZI